MSFVIDLDDAARREAKYPHGIPVHFGGEQFLYPAELPAKALDPLLTDELDLVGLLRDIFNASENPTAATIIDLLFKRSRLPRQAVEAIYQVHRVLLGEEQYARFEDLNPSVPAYIRVTVALVKVYGLDLGKSCGLVGSSENGGETSSPTSPASTVSTPAESGASLESPASSG
ncbi:hypothetical protein AB0C52_13140 [Streptomyces sp. NPDC048717]|uniref:hypothetical protein n=1 Tax=Streptomyces sp. NPDC048717 TaxID=3154928 RepID=UPI003435B9FC